MSRVYDSWEKLVGAVLDREELRRLALCDSFSSISTDFSSRFSFDSNPEVCTSSGQHIFVPRNLMAIEYEDIRKATRNFRRDCMLGEGSISYVYKGVINQNYQLSTSNIVAVKKMKHQGYEGLTEWVDKISHLRHPNLVTPIGYSSGTDQRIFVYEFMPKGSLDNHLFREEGLQQPLPWATRIRVAVGVARGLAFLHSLEIPVIYGVLKSGDILLDADFNAKLSDVGLPRDLSRRIIEGPFGIIKAVGDGYGPYAAPEYIATGQLRTRCEVYSFGVVLVELITGRRALDRNRAAGEHNLIDWAKPYLVNRRRLLQIMDTRLEGEYTLKEAYKVGQIALQCVSSNPTSRPRMAEVVAALEKLLVDPLLIKSREQHPRKC